MESSKFFFRGSNDHCFGWSLGLVSLGSLTFGHV